MQNSLSWGHVLIFFALACTGMWLYQKTKSKIVLGAVALLMICVAGLRHGYVDTRAYRISFLEHDPLSIFSAEYWLGDTKDRGFGVFISLIKMFTEDAQVFLFICSLITVGLIFYAIVKRVPQPEIGIFLMIATGCYLDTMNGLRQYLVAAVLFYFLPRLIIKEDFKKFLLLILLLSTIHGSALLLIPTYFIANKKPWSNATLTLAAILLLVYIFFNTGIGRLLAEMLDGTSYESYAEQVASGSSSVHPIRLAVAAVPLFLSLFNRDAEIKQTKRYRIAFNMSFINLMVWLFATKVLYFYRLNPYFTPHVIVHLCFELSAFKNNKEKKVLTLSLIFLYSLFWIFSLKAAGPSFFVGYLKY